MLILLVLTTIQSYILFAHNNDFTHKKRFFTFSAGSRHCRILIGDSRNSSFEFVKKSSSGDERGALKSSDYRVKVTPR